jgi:hypothetical protein
VRGLLFEVFELVFGVREPGKFSGESACLYLPSSSE